MAQQEIRALFLKEFFKHVVMNVKLPKNVNLPARKAQEDRISLSNLKPLPRINPPTRMMPPIMPRRTQIPIEKIESLNIVQKRMQQTEPVIKTIGTDSKEFQKSVMQGNQEVDNLSKLRPYINDRSVTSIECTGPNKQIIINRSGRMETTAFSLTDNEITNIMKEISDKTRIPLVSGVFKAAFEGFIITAVISDFVGTRFLLQRRNQNMMQMPIPQRPSQQIRGNKIPVPSNIR